MIAAYVDVPVSAQHFAVGYAYATGWAVNLATGQRPVQIGITIYQEGVRFELTVNPETGEWTEQMILGWSDTQMAIGYVVNYGPRPDVAAAYLPSCPAISSNTDFGYGITFPVPLAPGHYRFDVWAVDSPDVVVLSHDVYIDP